MVSENMVSKEGWTRVYLHRNRKEMMSEKVVSKEGWTKVYFHRNRKEMVSGGFQRGVDCFFSPKKLEGNGVTKRGFKRGVD